MTTASIYNRHHNHTLLTFIIIVLRALSKNLLPYFDDNLDSSKDKLLKLNKLQQHVLPDLPDNAGRLTANRLPWIVKTLEGASRDIIKLIVIDS